jgi:hypothetical protein
MMILYMNITTVLCRILNLGMNKLTQLPRGFGSFPVIEILDLSYNNLSENSLPANFFIMETLRALYLRYGVLGSWTCPTTISPRTASPSTSSSWRPLGLSSSGTV